MLWVKWNTVYRINLQIILNPYFQVHVCVARTCNGFYNTNLDESFYFSNGRLVQFFWLKHLGTNTEPTEMWKGSHWF